MRILAIIPAYNEEECLVNTINALVHACPDIDYLIVNDGSRDSTEHVILTNNLHAVTLPINTGLTSAFRTGMKYAYRHGYDAAVQFDADGQHIPSYIPIMADSLEQCSADIVIASRYLDGSVKPSGARGVGSRLISLLIKATTGVTITDPTSGMRMYNKRIIEQFARGFDIAPEPDMLADMARHGMTIVETPTKMLERQGGASYLKLGSVIQYMSRTCLSILLFRFLR